MLIFTRHCEEEIVIDQLLRLKVNGISGNRVTVAVTAPPDIPIRHSQQCDHSALDCGPLLVSGSEPVMG